MDHEAWEHTEILYQTKMTGQELIDAGYKVDFDPIHHRLGRSSAYYAEVARKDPETGHIDRMWTAPIWVEPLAGAKHFWYIRWLSGNAQQFIPIPY